MKLSDVGSSIASTASSAATTAATAARNTALSFRAGMIRPTGVAPATLTGINRFAFNVGRAAGLTVSYVRQLAAFVARGTINAWNSFVRAARAAGATIRVLATRVVRGIKNTTFRMFAKIRQGVANARNNYVARKQARLQYNEAVRSMRVRARTNARIDRSNRRAAWKAKSPLQKARTVAARVDNAYFRAAQKLVGDRTSYNELHPLPENATARQRYQQETAYARAVTRMATGLEAATATLAVSGITGAIHIAQNSPQGE